jgi:hypothetical protein
MTAALRRGVRQPDVMARGHSLTRSQAEGRTIVFSRVQSDSANVTETFITTSTGWPFSSVGWKRH